MTFHFATWPIRSSEIFFTSKLSFGLVNLKPIVPGHVLVISRRVVARFNDLSSDEVADLMLSAHTISKAIERQYNAESLTITLQDGPAAGQSVPHVHIHIIPRHHGDWMNNDDIYPEINKKETQLGVESAKRAGDAEAAEKFEQKLERMRSTAGPDSDRPPRTVDEMALEASGLRRLFSHYDDIWNTAAL
ncbi:HIT-like domain-containing protein [Entophlyctis helioformis]|nr:HIT-like domain-containing protein [Entophlyctis helioformis]